MPTYKTPRLKAFDYIGPYAYSLTIITSHRIRAFAEPTTLVLAEKQLISSAQKFGFRLDAYCFMPDHLHLLCGGERQESDLCRFVRHFKQMTGFAFKHDNERQLWQPSYWDHIVRLEEDLEDVARYIWANPLRAGLVTDWTTYCGSGPRPLCDVVAGLKHRNYITDLRSGKG